MPDSYGVPPAYRGWTALTGIFDWLCEHWDQPGEGIWRPAPARRNFTYGRFQT